MPRHDSGPLVVLPPLTPPQQGLPLGGLTVLAVEDSRFASDALRLMCQHSGARLRRAESLSAAQSHLRLYRPDVIIIDLGLPDGCGSELIAALSETGTGASQDRNFDAAIVSEYANKLLSECPDWGEQSDTFRRVAEAAHHVGGALSFGGDRTPIMVLGMSGDPAARARALAAGAHGFVEKPLPDLHSFQTLILEGLADRHLRPMAFAAAISPDPMALIDDLRLAYKALGEELGPREAVWLKGFLAGLAVLSADPSLATAAAAAYQPSGLRRKELQDLLGRKIKEALPLAVASVPARRGGTKYEAAAMAQQFCGQGRGAPRARE